MVRTSPGWSDSVPPQRSKSKEEDGKGMKKSVIWDLAYNPDGSRLAAAAGTRVLIYDAVDGDLVSSLKGHKGTVYSVDWSADGAWFASGGADKMVIIWSAKGYKGSCKYPHSDTVQQVKYNPVTQLLASCSAVDFGLWSPDQSAVTKYKPGSRILCCDWTSDGRYLVLGLFNGQVTVRDQKGEEISSVQRSEPIWTLACNPLKNGEMRDVFAVGCWDGTLSFYSASTGIQKGKERRLGYDPCTVSYFEGGKYLLVGGSDRRVELRSQDGVKLADVAKTDGWVWSCAARPKHSTITCGTEEGTISNHQLTFNTVHGLYGNRYAYRDNMTDVIVQHLLSDAKVRIKCRDYVKKIAIYRNRLAMQLPDKVVVYELQDDANPLDMHYTVCDRIHERLECNLLVVTSSHLILCQERKLQMYDFYGRRQKEWVLESIIRYIKVVGGPSGREGILVGLKNGVIFRIFVDNPFPIRLLKLPNSIRCLDLSASRRKIAVVDDKGNLTVHDLTTQEMLFQEKDATSVAWNTEMEDMLCFSGSGMLSIKTGNFPIHQQKMQGFVVGFNGSKIFCLHYVAMQTIDVPQSASLYRYLEIKDYPTAYKVACLGVTKSDWRLLALSALQGMDLGVARKAFIRVRDMKYLELLNTIEMDMKRGETKEDGAGSKMDIHLAEVMAYQGRYQDAAKIFSKCGEAQKAIDMFSDLRKWEDAKSFASSSSKTNGHVKDLIRKQAAWSEEVRDWKAASEMYMAAGEMGRAVAIVTKSGGVDDLIEVARTVDKENTEALKKCAEFFVRNDSFAFAKEVYLKMGDISALMKLLVNGEKWEDAFLLAQQHGKHFASEVYLPYARWLAQNDRFEEAHAALKKAGRPEESEKMLTMLSRSALAEERYRDAGFYLWMLSEEKMQSVEHGVESMTMEDSVVLADAARFRELACVYNAYDALARETELPYSTLLPEPAFNMARYLVSILGHETPFGISRSTVLWMLGEQGLVLGAYKLARYAFDKLQQLRVPITWVQKVDVETLAIHAKPFEDDENLHDVCYRCSVKNPLVNNAAMGDMCVQCSHPFVRSLVSFDLLPLVEFVPEKGVSDSLCLKYLREEPSSESTEEKRSEEKSNGFDRWENVDAGARGNGGIVDDDDDSMDDVFSQHMLKCEFNQPGAPYEPITVPAEILRKMNFANVYVKKWASSGKRWQFYANLVPAIHIVLCNNCWFFFHEEDLESASLANGGKCPMCRKPVKQVIEVYD